MMKWGDMPVPCAQESAQQNQFADDQIETLASLFKALAHPVRVRLLMRLSGSRRYCGDLVADSGLAQSTVSHHLRILREAGLINVEEQGTRTCYSINRERLEFVCDQFAQMRSW